MQEANLPSADVASRAAETLRLMHGWGFAPSLEGLAASLLGGSVEVDQLRRALTSGEVVLNEGFVCLRGHEGLLAPSKDRTASDRTLNGHGREVAREFAQDLYRICPFVRCLALSGSVASGGFRADDDIDFDLFVLDGTKYVSYLLGTLVGAKYAWRYRGRPVNPLHRTSFLPKVTCINVVWPDGEARPFARRDSGMAFELLRCQPLYGSAAFLDVVERNSWVRSFFPQLFERAWVDEIQPSRGALGRLLERLTSHRRLLRLLDVISIGLAWSLYHAVQRSRRGNPEAVARMEFLRRVKYPYEIFQKTV